MAHSSVAYKVFKQDWWVCKNDDFYIGNADMATLNRMTECKSDVIVNKTGIRICIHIYWNKHESH